MAIQTISQEDLEKIDPLLQFDHPRFALQKLKKIMDRVGVHTFLRGPKYGNDRDLFIGCFFAFYPRRVQGREWFIQKPERFPDIELASYTDRPLRDKPCDVVHVEITSIPEKIEIFEEALKSLANHKLGKLYQKDDQLVLLIFINNKHAPMWAKKFSSFFETSDDRFGQVFAIYFLDQNPTDIFVYEVDSLRPGGSNEVFRLSEEMNKVMLPNPYHDRFAKKISDLGK